MPTVMATIGGVVVIAGIIVIVVHIAGEAVAGSEMANPIYGCGACA
ncbi:MAG: hypothetical protein ACJ8CR_23995 [Roseiflexaceae bacterium]